MSKPRFRLGRLSVALVAVGAFAVLAVSAAVGASAFDSKANTPQVAGDPSSDATARFPTNKQNEPTIAVNPVNPNLLIAGANDEQRQPPCGPGPVRGTDAPANDCSFFPGVGTSGIYTSSDGGVTWTNRGLLDDQASWQASNLVSDGDPVIVYGPKPTTSGFSYGNGARAYYATLASYKPGSSPYPPNKAPELLAVSYSDNNGATWTAPVVATVKKNPNDFNDKESIWVDDLQSSPYFGRVYISWTEFRSVVCCPSEPVMVAVSTDGANSFGSPKKLSPSGNNGTGNGRQGSAVTSGPDGSVYVAWEQGSDQVVAISRNGGDNWTRPDAIGPVVDLDAAIPGANFRTDSFLSISADPRAGSTTLYAAWVNRTTDGGRVVVSTSTNRGLAWSALTTVSTAAEGYAFFQGLDVAPSGRVDLGYQALRAINPATFGTGNASIRSFYVSKPAAGAWSAPVPVSSAPSDPAASAQNNLALQFWGDYNTLVSGNSRAWFIYTDARFGQGCSAVDQYQRDGVSKPAPQLSCPPQFGNTDAFVSTITP